MVSQQKLNRKTDFKSLVADLASGNPTVREMARESLIAKGTNAVTKALVGELSDPRDHVRWEAAKALSSLADPVSAPALVNALDDDNSDVCWIAGEGLIALGETGLLAVLHALTKRASSITFRHGASHVLHGCAKSDYADILAPVFVTLAGWEPGVTVPPAAYRALLDLKVGMRQKT